MMKQKLRLEMAVPINATCAIAANEQEMLMFLEKANVGLEKLASAQGAKSARY